MKTFVVGDTHGSFKGLMQALALAQFDASKDKLIVLGDTQDGWSQAPELMEYYMALPADSLIYLLGNHDQAFIEWHDNGCQRHLMESHGGWATRIVYQPLGTDVIARHAEWLRMQRHSYLDEQNRFFVHAGWSPEYTFDNPGQKSMQEYLWNRSFWQGMFEGRNYAKGLKEVFIGHSPVTRHKPYTDQPMNRRNVWNLDTAAAFNGRVTVMDIESKAFWQSDKCQTLYPLERGRN